MDLGLSRVEYVNGYVEAYDARGVLLTRQRCDKLVGYGPKGFVVMRGNCYWVHKASGQRPMPPMIPYGFAKSQWDMHDTYLQVRC